MTDSPDIFTFWDYQAGAWQKNNGIRIDHLLLSPEAADRLASASIEKHVRSWEKPSDHVPAASGLDPEARRRRLFRSLFDLIQARARREVTWLWVEDVHWLDASSWDEVVPALKGAGHDVQALTLPGLESPDADRRDIHLRDHVDAVVRAIDAAADPVVLVGHSGGGAIAHAAADARPERIERVVYVDAGPLGEGHAINDGLPVVDGEIPLPDWSVFDEADLRDVDDALRASFRILYKEGRTRQAALDRIEADFGTHPEVREFVTFIRTTVLGINRARDSDRQNWEF